MNVGNAPDENASDERRQTSFLRAIRQQDDAVAELYLAGLQLVGDNAFPGRAPLIAHVVRELLSNIPRAFVSKDPSERPRVEYHGRIKPLYGAWEPVAESIRNSATTFEAVPSIAVPLSVAVVLDKLIDDDKYVEGKLKHQFLRMCIAVNNESIKWSGNETLAQQWKDLETHDMAHLGKKPDVDRAIAKFRELEQIAFNVFNHGADRERRNLELIAGLTPETLKPVILKMVTLNDHITFYTELKRADVLLGLEQLGKFKFVDDSITIWPPAIYLKNVAEEDPTNVSRILISLKASEPGIVNQLLLATLKLPKQDLVRIVNKSASIRVCTFSQHVVVSYVA